MHHLKMVDLTQTDLVDPLEEPQFALPLPQRSPANGLLRLSEPYMQI